MSERGKINFYPRQIVKNEHGVEIAKCCLSCAHVAYDSGDMRVCRVGCGHVNGASYCPAYKMHSRYIKVGKTQLGGIHKPHWLKWLMERRFMEQKARLKPRAVETLQREYEEQNGTIWLCRPNFSGEL